MKMIRILLKIYQNLLKAKRELLKLNDDNILVKLKF